MTTMQAQPVIAVQEAPTGRAAVRARVKQAHAPLDSLLLKPCAKPAPRGEPGFDLLLDRPLWVVGAFRTALLVQGSLAMVGLLCYEVWSLSAR